MHPAANQCTDQTADETAHRSAYGRCSALGRVVAVRWVDAARSGAGARTCSRSGSGSGSGTGWWLSWWLAWVVSV